MIKEEFLSGARFKVVDQHSQLFTNCTYYYHAGAIMAIDSIYGINFHAHIMGIDSTSVFVLTHLLGQEVRNKIPFNNLEII